MSNKGIGVGECVKHGEYFLDAYDSPCPSCEDECEHPLLTESNWCPECGYITEDEDECNHPALYESCPDEGQGATWYCPDCESVVEINNE
jgi:hypothetical protein